MRLLLFWLCLLLGSIAQAQQPTQAPQPAIAKLTKIPYQRRLPAAVARLMPRTAKSRFWGTFRLQPKGPLYGVHLYNLFPEPKPKPGDTSYFFGQDFLLDIFQVQRGSQRWGRIKHMPVNYHSHSGVDVVTNFSKFSASWTWLNSSSQKGLVLQFDIFGPEGEYGDLGDNVFIALPQGLAGPATFQSLPFGKWRGSSNSGQSNRLVRDSTGWLQLDVWFEPATSELTAEQVERDYHFRLPWNNQRNKFWPTEKVEQVLEKFPKL